MPDKTKIPEKNTLRELRHDRNLSQWGLAVRAGTSATTVSAIERWGYKPGVDLRERIATALGVNVADIWGEVSHEQS